MGASESERRSHDDEKKLFQVSDLFLERENEERTESFRERKCCVEDSEREADSEWSVKQVSIRFQGSRW